MQRKGPLSPEVLTVGTGCFGGCACACVWRVEGEISGLLSAPPPPPAARGGAGVEDKHSLAERQRRWAVYTMILCL